jgi:hypothetical protein
MNKSHIIDSWIAELALVGRARRPPAQRVTAGTTIATAQLAGGSTEPSATAPRPRKRLRVVNPLPSAIGQPLGVR